MDPSANNCEIESQSLAAGDTIRWDDSMSIGDAIVDRCERDLGASLDIDLTRHETWNVCGEQKVFDRYSMTGETSDEEACRQIFLDECSAELED